MHLADVGRRRKSGNSAGKTVMQEVTNKCHLNEIKGIAISLSSSLQQSVLALCLSMAYAMHSGKRYRCAAIANLPREFSSS